MHGEFKELILRIDSLHQIEMSQMFTESGSSYKKGEKRYPPCTLLDFSKQIQFQATKMQLRV